MTKEVSKTLMVANLFCTVLVIAIHYGSQAAIDTSNGLNFNYYLQELITNGLARIAVPFFALISGFFFFRKLQGDTCYRTLLREKAKTLLLPYLVASLAIFISFGFLKLVFAGGFTYFNSLQAFLLHVTVEPVSVQFWYLRDLLILFLTTPVLIALGRTIQWGALLLSFTFWLCNIQPMPIVGEWYLINSEVLFFFLLGGILFSPKLIEQLITLAQHKNVIIAWVTLLAIRILLDPTLNVWYDNDFTVLSLLLYKASILVGMVAILGLSKLFIESRFLIELSGLTFFVYLFHLKPLSTVLVGLTPDKEHSFYLLFPIATVVTFVLAYMMSRLAIPLFRFLTGGRSPHKALSRAY